jgi:hypothetical protein
MADLRYHFKTAKLDYFRNNKAQKEKAYRKRRGRSSTNVPLGSCILSVPNPNEYDQFNDILVDSVYTLPPPQSTVTIILSSTGGTTDTEPGGYYYYGYTAEVISIPDEDYEFDYWGIDGNYQSTDNPIYQQTWDSDHYLVAHFIYTPTAQKLTVSATGGGTTDPAPGDHWYNYGTGAEVDAEGSGFSYWLLDGEYVSTSSSISVTMDQYHTLEAHFNETLPTCSLMVCSYLGASEQYPVYTNVYVNSQYAGQSFTAINVPLGTQQIMVDDYVDGLSIWYNDYGYGSVAEMDLWSLHNSITFVYIAGK